MRMRALVTVGLLGFALSTTGNTTDPRMGLSGIWSGLRNQLPLEGCQKADDGETPAAITLRVEENGVVTGKDPSGRRFTGTIGEDLSLNLELRGRAKCMNEQQPHDWTAGFTGQITSTDRGPKLLMSGVEQPCPPSCSFSVTYTLARNQ